MKLNRVLVLVLTLVMIVSACAPSVLAIFKPETKHEHSNVLDNPEYKEEYEEIKAVVEDIVKDIEENHEEYYANGYAYALENGYIDDAKEAIALAIKTLPEIDLDGLGITEELKAELQTELDALVPTLEKILAILESGEASEFDGFVNAMLTLEEDLYIHLDNIYGILEQGSIDLNQIVLVPEFNKAIRVLEDEVLPAIAETIEAFVDYVIDQVVEVVGPYYDKVVEIIDITRETYERIIAIIVKINLYVENTIEKIEGAYDVIVFVLAQFYDNVNDAIDVVEGIFNEMIDVLFKVGTDYRDAIALANKIYNYVVNFVTQSNAFLQNGVDLFSKIHSDLVAIIERAPKEADAFVSYVRSEITAYVMNTITNIVNAHNSALNAEYELTKSSMYVALGTSPFGKELAGKLNLSKKYFQFGLRDNYLARIKKADLITIKLDNGEFVGFAEKQVMGTVASVVRSNERLMSFYKHPIIGAYVKDVIEGMGIDINAQTENINWDLYLDAEAQEILDDALELARTELIERGVPEYYYIDLQPMVQDALEDSGLSGLSSISINIDPIEVPVADIAIYGLESALYAYARFTNDFSGLLENIYAAAPNATVVLLGIDNPLYGFDFSKFGIDCVDYSDCVSAVDRLIQTFNAQLYFAAMENENTVFVPENDADAIYDAINVHCDHAYDDCEDKTCNICGEVRTAPGHSFTKYTVVVNATCGKDGSKRAKCDYCNATRTEVIPKTNKHNWTAKTCTSPETCSKCNATRGSAMGHFWEEATCEHPQTCRYCGITQGSVADHTFGVWKVIVEATRKTTGCKERVCLECGLAQRQIIPIIPPKYTTGTIVAVVVSALVFSTALFSFILWRLRKKDLLK